MAADREVWSGEATVVNARTLAGEIGIMADHTPVMSVLAAGQVDVRTVDDGHWVAAVDGASCRWPTTTSGCSASTPSCRTRVTSTRPKRLLDERKAALEGDA